MRAFSRLVKVAGEAHGFDRKSRPTKNRPAKAVFFRLHFLAKPFSHHITQLELPSSPAQIF